MGLSASQARFLMLTANKSNLEYKAQILSHERLEMAKHTEIWTKEYNEKMNNTMLVFTNFEDRTKEELNYTAVTTSIEDGGMGMFITEANGKIVVGSEDEIPEDLSDEEKAKYVVDPNVLNVALFEKGIREGIYFISQKDESEENGIKQFSIAGLNNVQEVPDKTDDAAAESEHQVNMAKAQKYDKMLELELDQIETQHKAIETEIESVGKVIEKNIENSFKTFG